MRHFRKKAGLKAVHVAEACGVAPSTYSCWEHGLHEPGHEKLALFARKCGIDLGAFWSTPLVIVPQAAGG